jgi:hypothetical protein
LTNEKIYVILIPVIKNIPETTGAGVRVILPVEEKNRVKTILFVFALKSFFPFVCLTRGIFLFYYSKESRGENLKNAECKSA